MLNQKSKIDSRAARDGRPPKGAQLSVKSPIENRQSKIENPPSPINEDQFLAELFPQLSVSDEVVVPPGDDAAAINIGGDRLLLVTVDQVAEAIHYFGRDSKSPTPPELVGRKLIARNISDIAAMGGDPAYAVLALAVTRDTDQSWLEQLAHGVTECAAEFDIHIIGGDLTAAAAQVASLTLFGFVDPNRICRRNQAKVGDLIFVTGEFGASLETEKHLRFTPRLSESKWLAQNQLTRAMIDVSDGLLKDLGRVCISSRVGAVIDTTNIPSTVRDGTPVSIQRALTDGEDYELLFAVNPQNREKLLETWPFPTKLTEVGAFPESEGKNEIISESGENLNDLFGTGFDHFK